MRAKETLLHEAGAGPAKPTLRSLPFTVGEESQSRLSVVTPTSSIIIRITTVHPFATSWPSSPKGDARTLRDWLSVSYVTQYPVPPIFSFPLEGKSREAGKGVRGRAPVGSMSLDSRVAELPYESSFFATSRGNERYEGKNSESYTSRTISAFSPFGGWRHHLPAPLGSVSLDSQSPTAPCESSSLATASGGTMGA